jgi:hypothetical protein
MAIAAVAAAPETCSASTKMVVVSYQNRDIH